MRRRTRALQTAIVTQRGGSPTSPSQGATRGDRERRRSPIQRPLEAERGEGSSSGDRGLAPSSAGEVVIGTRNLREMRTLTTVLDLLVQAIRSSRILQAMDTVSQRIKSVELFVSQGSSGRRAYSREEVKVAQIEQ